MSKIGIIVRIKELFERDCKTRNTINQNESFDLIRENSLKMVDSHSLNSVAAPTSAFNFKSGDISGTAAKRLYGTSSTKGTITSTQRRWGSNVRCVKFTEVDAE